MVCGCALVMLLYIILLLLFCFHTIVHWLRSTGTGGQGYTYPRSKSPLPAFFAIKKLHVLPCKKKLRVKTGNKARVYIQSTYLKDARSLSNSTDDLPNTLAPGSPQRVDVAR